MMSKWATKWGVEHQLVVSPKNWGFQDLLSLCASCKFSRLAGSLHRGSWKWMFFRVQAERVSKWWFVVTFSQKYEIIFIWCLYMPSTSTLLMIALDQPRHPANEQLFSTRHATWDMCQMASRENRSKLEFLQDDMLAQQASSPMMASLVCFFVPTWHFTQIFAAERYQNRGRTSRKILGGWTKTNPEANASSC